MAYTARDLITRAFYLSQVRSKTLNNLTGEDITTGLELLNALIGFKSADMALIPYYSARVIETVQGEEKYFVPDLLEFSSLTFEYNDIRYAINHQGRVQYFGSSRANNISSLPFSCRVERCKGGANVYLYFLPSQVFEVTIWAKYALAQIQSLEDDLSLTYDYFYIEYLRYALAQYVCGEYASTFPKQAEDIFKEIVKKVVDPSPPDLSVQKSSYFSAGSYINYAIVNLSYGYLPN